jgi:hypothetical protein
MADMDIFIGIPRLILIIDISGYLRKAQFGKQKNCYGQADFFHVMVFNCVKLYGARA